MKLRRLTIAACAVFAFAFAAPVSVSGVSVARAQVSAEFQAALQPYGAWRRHARWGQVWVPAHRPRNWRPYTYGHWVYTDDWGWYWISDRAEEDWGWVTYHYGRWVLDRRMGWVWVRGTQWAPAWVNWRRGGDYIGWSPLPPDAMIVEYEAEPVYWIFVQPRDLIAPRLQSRILPPTRTAALLRKTVVVNRTLLPAGGHVTVNAGVAPATVGAAAHTSIPTYRVAPRVLATTQGVAGAVPVRPRDLGRRAQSGRRGASPFAIAVQKTSTVIKPAAAAPKPVPFGKGEPGRLGTPAPGATLGTGTPPPPPPAARPAVVAPPAARPVELPPQAKPARPIAPPPPPPPLPEKSESRMPPPAATRQAPPPAAVRPPPRPVAPVAKPVVAPKPPTARPPAPPPRKKLKPGDKRDDKN